ncbi:MAG: hypothetical protein Q4C56_03375 [Peptococcaceae bacterium]|nr:hypothetical protein [Peptococcaceae bacterium]
MEKRKNMYYIHVAIYLIITFGIGFLPPFAQITELGMRVLGVFLGVIYAWCFIALDWTSILSLCFLAAIGYGEGGDALFLSGWSFQTIPPMILSFIFAEGIAQSRLTQYVADKILSLKIFKGKPYVLLSGMLITLAILTLLQCNYAGLFLLWGVSYSISDRAGFPKKNTWNTMVIASTIAVFVWASYIFPFMPGPLMQISFFSTGMPDAEIPFVGWFVIWACYCLIYCIAWPLLIKFILRPDLSAIANVDLSTTYQGKTKMLPDQKFCLAILIAFIVAMVSPQFLPDGWAITKVFTTLGLSGCLGIACAILAAYKKADGEHYISLQTAANAISWNIIWLLVATEPLASAFNSEECGILSSIMTVVTPLLTALSPSVFLIICMVVLGLATQFIHNMVLIVVFIPLLCPLYVQMGGNPFVMFLALAVAMNAAFTTPAASWSSAMMFGAENIITSKMYLHGFSHFVFSLLLFLVLIMPLASILMPY